MADVSDRPRTFVVWLNKQVPQVATAEARVTVEAGEDADQVCADVLDAMIGGEIDTGWRDETDDDESEDDDV